MDKTTVDWDEMNRSMMDLSLIDYGYQQWKLGACSSIEFHCWNKEEADKYRHYVDKRYPGLPIKFAWFTFENE